MPEVVIYGRSPSVVVDYIATFVDLEHGLEFTVDDYVHGLFQCGCKLNLDAEITLSCQMETTIVATFGVRSKPKKVLHLPKSSRDNSFPSSCDCLTVAEIRG